MLLRIAFYPLRLLTEYCPEAAGILFGGEVQTNNAAIVAGVLICRTVAPSAWGDCGSIVKNLASRPGWLAAGFQCNAVESQTTIPYLLASRVACMAASSAAAADWTFVMFD